LEKGKLGRLWKEHGIAVEEVFELSDLVFAELGVRSLQDAATRALPRVALPAVSYDVVRAHDWALRPVNSERAAAAGLHTWVIRELWSMLAHVEPGYPPQTRVEPLPVGDIVLSLTCEHCEYRALDDGDLAAHIAKEHTHPCHLCDLVLPFVEDLEEHMLASHARCTRCGTWCVDKDALRQHNDEEHKCPCCSKVSAPLF
jgi:hypothetical protein